MNLLVLLALCFGVGHAVNVSNSSVGYVCGVLGINAQYCNLYPSTAFRMQGFAPCAGACDALPYLDDPRGVLWSSRYQGDTGGEKMFDGMCCSDDQNLCNYFYCLPTRGWVGALGNYLSPGGTFKDASLFTAGQNALYTTPGSGGYRGDWVQVNLGERWVCLLVTLYVRCYFQCLTMCKSRMDIRGYYLFSRSQSQPNAALSFRLFGSDDLSGNWTELDRQLYVTWERKGSRGASGKHIVATWNGKGMGSHRYFELKNCNSTCAYQHVRWQCGGIQEGNENGYLAMSELKLLAYTL